MPVQFPGVVAAVAAGEVAVLLVLVLLAPVVAPRALLLQVVVPHSNFSR